MIATTVDITTLAATFALITTLIVQLLKPIIELIPGLRDPNNQVAHDNLLRLLQLALNLAMLFAATQTAPTVFAGLQWWDLLGVVLGQGVISHVTFSVVSQGATAPNPTSGTPPSNATNLTQTSPVPFGSAAVTDFPTVPRG